MPFGVNPSESRDQRRRDKSSRRLSSLWIDCAIFALLSSAGIKRKELREENFLFAILSLFVAQFQLMNRSKSSQGTQLICFNWVRTALLHYSWRNKQRRGSELLFSFSISIDVLWWKMKKFHIAAVLYDPPIPRSALLSYYSVWNDGRTFFLIFLSLSTLPLCYLWLVGILWLAEPFLSSSPDCCVV